MNEAQKQVLFDAGVAKHSHYLTSRAREEEIARVQVKARVQADMDDRNVFYASLVDEHGFTIADVGRIMGTTNRGTPKAAVEAGRVLRPEVTEPAESIPITAESESQKYTYDAATKMLTVHLDYEDFRPHLALLPVDPSEDGEDFTFRHESDRLLPATEDEDAWQHPVVALTMTPKGQKEALAFIEKQ